MHQTLQQCKFENADFKYDKNIFKFQLKNTQVRHFRSQTWRFLFLNQTLHKYKFEEAYFKYDNSIFKYQPQIRKSSIFGPKLRIFVFSRILQLDKFGVLISNMTILFSNSSPKYPNKIFLVPNLGIFVFFTIFGFAPNFATR